MSHDQIAVIIGMVCCVGVFGLITYMFFKFGNDGINTHKEYIDACIDHCLYQAEDNIRKKNNFES